MAFQTPKMAPKMAPEALGMACLAPKMASELPLRSKPIDQKPSETIWKTNILNKSQSSVAHVGSWQHSWPQNGLQDLQDEPSKAKMHHITFQHDLSSPQHGPEDGS